MRTNAKQLAMRDPAMAAILGAIPGADFGAEDDFGDDFGEDFGVDAAPAGRPSQAQLMAAWKASHSAQAATNARSRLLYPNRGASRKIERYTFSINASITLGTSAAISMSGSPAVTIRPQRVTINAPAPGFLLISDIKVANTSATLGGLEDAFNYNANGVGQALDMPTVSPSTQASILGNYSGYVPTGFVSASPYVLSGTFKGPAWLNG